MANEITFGYVTGATLTYGVYQPDGTVRTAAATALTEVTGTGYYKATNASIVAGDFVIIKQGTLEVGQGQYNPNTEVATKTGFKLASDGLDSVATTEPSGKASNFREMIVQVWRRLFGKTTLTTSELKTYKTDGTTVATTQVVSETGTTRTQGEAS